MAGFTLCATAALKKRVKGEKVKRETANGQRPWWTEPRSCPPKPLATAGAVTGFSRALNNLCGDPVCTSLA